MIKILTGFKFALKMNKPHANHFVACHMASSKNHTIFMVASRIVIKYCSFWTQSIMIINQCY